MNLVTFPCLQQAAKNKIEIHGFDSSANQVAQRFLQTGLVVGLEGVGWLAVTGFVWLVSDVVLMTPVQRAGLFSTLFLATWALNLGLFVVSGMTVQRQWHHRSFWAIGVLAIFLLMIFAAGFDAFGSMEPVD